MKKDFDAWNESKKRIDAGGAGPFFREREIWWAYLGLNIGSEQNGSGKRVQRPILILKGFSRTTCLIAPLTTSVSRHPYRISVGIVDGKEASAIISQIRVVDSRRFINRVAILDEQTFDRIRKSVTLP